MNIFIKILLIIILLIYILSPFDIMPDFAPFWGWIDDALLAGLLYYYFTRGRLPNFVTSIFGRSVKDKARPFGGGRNDRRSTSPDDNGSGANSGKKNSYEILGLKPGASEEEIHTAYRKAAQEYHPDKVAHLGEALQKLAREKFIEIQNAYETLTGKNR